MTEQPQEPAGAGPGRPARPAGLDLPALRGQVEACLLGFLEGKAGPGRAGGAAPAEAAAVLRDFVLGGGKRLRPSLCAAGWHAAGGRGTPREVVTVAAALEMFHAFALIHDDVMDRSPARRGRPSLHRLLAASCAAGRPRASARRLGVALAVLLGDLALVWSDELLHTAGLSPGQSERVLPLIDAMRQEVMHGQYLDLTSAGRPTPDVEAALRIARGKTAGYTVRYPLLIGAALAGAGDGVGRALTAYALPLGEAFQLRDDLLGVFGDPRSTGKSPLDDLREGKHTALTALALRRADRERRAVLEGLLGDPRLTGADADRLRAVLTGTGARAEVEDMIRRRHAEALRALDGARFPPDVRATLRTLAQHAVDRAT
ncbi:polyprenyl synthetase family protein [Streptomyces capparidis]